MQITIYQNSYCWTLAWIEQNYYVMSNYYSNYKLHANLNQFKPVCNRNDILTESDFLKFPYSLHIMVRLWLSLGVYCL